MIDDKREPGSDPVEVTYISGKTRLFGIVGHPIEQVRSPEMFTGEFVRRGHDAILVPLHVRPEHFDTCLPGVLKIANLDGLIFTIPYKATACALAHRLGSQARVVGAINALSRDADGRWAGDIFDGMGCVEAFRRRGIALQGRRVMLIGAGGAGAAIGVAMAGEQPASIRVFDVDATRADALANKIRDIDVSVSVEVGPSIVENIDVLVNATPVGMLDDPRLPIAADRIDSGVVVFDAIVKPERTPLIALAERSGCTTVCGREMMRGQIDRMIDFFMSP